jgi:RimJ/RimL family protein N-acetyltransferase
MLPLPEPLPENQQELRRSLPLKPEGVTLEGRFVRLMPTQVEADVPLLYRVSNGSPIDQGGLQYPAYDAEVLIWRFLFGGGPFATMDEFSTYCQRQVDAPNALSLTAFELAGGNAVGMTSIMSNSPTDLKIELGSIWYSPVVQRTPVNTEATFLMLRHCFGLGYRRVEWKCNALNERSRRAALRMGFTFEGIQENHMIVKDRSRDTAWYRILDREWPDVQCLLQDMLYGNC